MRKPDHMPSFAAGHAIIALALGVSLMVMLALLMIGH